MCSWKACAFAVEAPKKHCRHCDDGAGRVVARLKLDDQRCNARFGKSNRPSFRKVRPLCVDRRRHARRVRRHREKRIMPVKGDEVDDAGFAETLQGAIISPIRDGLILVQLARS